MPAEDTKLIEDGELMHQKEDPTKNKKVYPPLFFTPKG